MLLVCSRSQVQSCQRALPCFVPCAATQAPRWLRLPTKRSLRKRPGNGDPDLLLGPQEQRPGRYSDWRVAPPLCPYGPLFPLRPYNLHRGETRDRHGRETAKSHHWPGHLFLTSPYSSIMPMPIAGQRRIPCHIPILPLALGAPSVKGCSSERMNY